MFRDVLLDAIIFIVGIAAEHAARGAAIASTGQDYVHGAVPSRHLFTKQTTAFYRAQIYVGQLSTFLSVTLDTRFFTD